MTGPPSDGFFLHFCIFIHCSAYIFVPSFGKFLQVVVLCLLLFSSCCFYFVIMEHESNSNSYDTEVKDTSVYESGSDTSMSD
jgi:hypothetical protein